ncbi:MAG: hypothetical protein CMO55_01050 [Verrucomicrobiales bacterium]|nr:hypothetical protein [Verrucomicrobiales bacterium]
MIVLLGLPLLGAISQERDENLEEVTERFLSLSSILKEHMEGGKAYPKNVAELLGPEKTREFTELKHGTSSSLPHLLSVIFFQPEALMVPGEPKLSVLVVMGSELQTGGRFVIYSDLRVMYYSEDAFFDLVSGIDSMTYPEIWPESELIVP